MVQDLQGVTRKILLVDDEPSLQKMLTHALEREGFQVQVAGDGEAALEAFKTYEPHLIVLDIMLPKLDGTEVIRRIRSQSDVPVIMLTARDDEIDRVVGLELGADDYVTKPFAGRVFSRSALLRRVWGDEFRDERTVDVHIRHLREKIERDPRNPEFIHTARGVGYVFR